MIPALDIATLAAAYDAGATTPQAVIDAILSHIAETGERPVWIAVASREKLYRRIAEIARLKAEGADLPLYGIPFAAKDNIDAADFPTTAACPEFSYMPARSATAVEKLEKAGAILIGKTNLDQFATGLVGTRSPYGIPCSVFDDRYISGGSSSGSAVAVGAGLVSFSLGTDTAGSGRVPAGFNNIVGIKPTKGLISTRGVVPACRTQDCVSIFAGTVGDAHAVLSIVSGVDDEDPYSRDGGAAATRLTALPEGFRFGVPEAALDFFGDDAAARLYAAAIARLESIGGVHTPIDFTPFAQTARMLYAGPWVAERLAGIEAFATTKPEAIHPVVGNIIQSATKLTAVDSFKGFYKLAELTRAAEHEWTKMDVLLLPTTGTTYTIEALLADPVQLNTNLGAYTNFTNLMDLAAIAIPAGFRDADAHHGGLPFGVTLLALRFTDGLLALLGDRLHRALSDATMGATGRGLPETSRLSPTTDPNRIAVAVVGAHLSGQPLNKQLVERHARLVATTCTGPGYALYALPGTVPAKPGLMYDGKSAGGIEVEVWEMDAAGFGSLVALIPPPLGIGTLTLADGGLVKGFLCEPHALTDATDITSYGGWRNWLASKPA